MASKDNIGETEDDRFRLVVESAPHGIIVADETGGIVMVNRRAEELFGYDRKSFLKKTIEDLVPPRYRKGHGALRVSFLEKPSIRKMGAGRDLYAVKKGGEEFPVEIGLTPLSNGSSPLVLCTVVDITERKAAEEAIRFQSEILHNVHDAVFYIRPNGQILNWNEGAERIFGIKKEDIIGESLFSFLDPTSGDACRERFFRRIEKEGQAEEVMRCGLAKGESGQKITLRVKGTSLKQKGEPGYVMCASDITVQKQLEAKIVSISENEQRRIGRDLHDDLCSQLSGIACLTKAMETKLSQHQQEEAEMMAQVSDMVSDAVTKARQMAKGLVPAALENQGLKGALEELVERTSEIFGVFCRMSRCDSVIAREMSPGTASQVFRIAQEAVTNAVKHSDAELIEVILKQGKEEGTAELQVRDDGKGMPTDMVSAGIGLLTMKERAELIGAEFDIHGLPGKGTVISCLIPLEYHSD